MIRFISTSGARIEEVPWVAPQNVFSHIHHLAGALWLDSQTQNTYGTWSVIAYSPSKLISANVDDEPIVTLRTSLSAHPNPWVDLPSEISQLIPPFLGGMAGVFGYELGRALEDVKTNGPLIVNGKTIPDLCIGLYPSVLSFNHSQQRCFIVATGIGSTERNQRQTADTQIEQWRALLDLPAGDVKSPSQVAHIESNFSRDEYMEAVANVIDLIRDGEIFQANISQCYTGQLMSNDDGFGRYLKMRQINPASFGGFFRGDNWSLASNSPERLIALAGDKVNARPIKGTVPRSTNPIEDNRFVQKLLASDKDKAENIMIVDLLRNDLARVCHDFSIDVPELCVLESHAHVHHLVSTITGTLTRDNSAIDLLSACFPGGSITGAPKIRAMDIIAQIEQRPRGPYCGSLGYIGFNGHMDMNILIRSIVQSGSEFVFNVGGGITAQSNPADEYQETLDKAAGVFQAIGVNASQIQTTTLSA